MPATFYDAPKTARPGHKCGITLNGFCMVCGKRPDSQIVQFNIGKFFVKKSEQNAFTLMGPNGEATLVGEDELQMLWEMVY